MRSTRAQRRARRAGVVATALLALLALAGTATARINVAVQPVSSDPYTNTSAYHQTQVEPDTFSFGSTIVSAFQTGRFPDGGADNIGWATSKDNGATWTKGFLPGTTVFATPAGPWARISDPAVAYDPEHNVWMISGLGIDASATGKAILVSRSTDGLNWSNPVTVSVGGPASFYDKEWITCDTWASSPNFGNCYVQWDDFGLGNVLRMSRSLDGGLTWSASTAPGSSVLGGQPVVQPNGNVVVPINDGFQSRIQSFLSTNGGASYTGPTTVANINSHFVAGGLRTSPLPSAEVDSTGRVYVVWQDCRFRAGCSANDIVMSTSTNGTTWSAVTRIPIVPASSTADFFIPGIGVDRTTGGAGAHLGLTFYAYPNANCSFTTCRLLGGFVSSTNGGATWSAPKKLVGPILLDWLPNANGPFVGDYVSTSYAGDGKAYTVIANATTGNCTLGQITSCHEFMVAPVGGLSSLSAGMLGRAGGTRSVNPNQKVRSAHGERAPTRAQTAF